MILGLVRFELSHAGIQSDPQGGRPNERHRREVWWSKQSGGLISLVVRCNSFRVFQ